VVLVLPADAEGTLLAELRQRWSLGLSGTALRSAAGRLSKQRRRSAPGTSTEDSERQACAACKGQHRAHTCERRSAAAARCRKRSAVVTGAQAGSAGGGRRRGNGRATEGLADVEEQEEEYEVEAILSSRRVGGHTEYLIKQAASPPGPSCELRQPDACRCVQVERLR
jgi:hypothetical protein